MWELDRKQSWAPNNWWFWTVVLKTLKSPLDCKIKPVHPKGNQSWIFTGRTDAEAETPILWPPDGKNWLIGKDPDAGQDWRPEEKWMAEDEMVAWHHRLHGHEFEQAPGVGDGQGSLVCCSPWGHKESDTSEQLNWTEEKKRTVISKLKSKLYKILSPLLSSSYDSHFSTRCLKLFCKYSIVFTLLSFLPLFLALLILCRSPGTSREQRKEEPWSGSFPAGKERSRGRKTVHAWRASPSVSPMFWMYKWMNAIDLVPPPQKIVVLVLPWWPRGENSVCPVFLGKGPRFNPWLENLIRTVKTEDPTCTMKT